jgi:hypothetical protein
MNKLKGKKQHLKKWKNFYYTLESMAVALQRRFLKSDEIGVKDLTTMLYRIKSK